jgi:cellobionic acid phosphorylase
MAKNVKSNQPVAQFVDDGARYVVRDPLLVDQGCSHLLNDRMLVKIDLRGRCSSYYNQPARSGYSQNLRTFYVRDDETGRFWSVPFDPVQAQSEAYEFSAGRADIQWRAVVEEVEVRLRLVVPRDDTVELWTVTATNLSKRPRKLSLYSYFPVGLMSWLSQSARYDAKLGGIVVEHFPYYVRVEDYYKLKDRNSIVFCAGDRKPLAAQANDREFLGLGGPREPEALNYPKLPGDDAIFEAASMIMQYRLRLGPDQGETINLAFGPAADRRDMSRLIRKYLRPGGIDKALARVHAHLESIAPQVRIDTPDAELNSFVNHWLPHQTSFCGGLLRMNGAPCVRNALQDSMGIAWTNPARARQWVCTVLGHQHADGFLPHGAPLTPGAAVTAINSIPHRDMNAWPPLVLDFYVNETGDLDILDQEVGFADSDESVSVYDHVCRGLDWLLRDRSKRGLSHLGEGDWDDPLNMAGAGGKGESVWLTQTLAAGLDAWSAMATRVGDTRRSSRYRREADKCRQAINDLAWDGRWYARGTTDAGRWFGTSRDREGKVWLNAQSWAMICGAADTPRRISQCMAAVDRYLMTDSGPMTLAPAFTSMREDIGKITQKTGGICENGSVYCHAAAFYAYGLYRARQGDEAFKVLRRLLAGDSANTLARSQQLPLFVPNFFRGEACGKTAGRSSNNWGTGTAAWYYRTIVTELLGVRGECDGLRIDPQLPGKWKRARVWRRFRGAEFDISIGRSAKAESLVVKLDGRELEDNFIPVQAKGSRHEVQVLLGR